MKPDEKVKEWYSSKVNWDASDHGYDNYIMSMSIESLITNKNVLNLGCFFPNIELIFAHKASYWASIDFCPEVIDRCKKEFEVLTNYVSFLEMDMRNLKFLDSSFDVVLDLSSGDHLELDDYIITLDQVKRVLRKSGYFVITYANSLHIPDGEIDAWGTYGYERRISPSNLKSILEEKKFVVVDENSTMSRSGLVCVNK